MQINHVLVGLVGQIVSQQGANRFIDDFVVNQPDAQTELFNSGGKDLKIAWLDNKNDHADLVFAVELVNPVDDIDQQIGGGLKSADFLAFYNSDIPLTRKHSTESSR